MTKKKWLALLLAVGLLGMAIGYFARPIGQSAFVAKEPVRIQFWHGMADDSAHGRQLKNMIEQFNASQKEIIVEGIYQGSYSDLERKVTAAAQAHNAVPAITQATDSMVTSLITNKLAQPLEKLVPAAELKDFPANYLEHLKLGNQLYALPFNKSLAVLIYNTRLVPTPPRTWAEFTTMARMVTGKRMAGTAFSADVYTFGLYFRQAGGQWLKNGMPGFAGPEGVKALSLMQGMVEDGSAIMLKPGEYQSDFFNQGRVAMIATTTASFAYIKPINGDAWAAAPVPAGPAGAFTAQSGANLVLTATDPDQAKAAAKFMLWLTSKEGTLQWAMGKTGYGPVRLSAVADPRWQAFVTANPEYAPLGTEMSRALAQPADVRWANVQKRLSDAVNQALLGRQSVEDALAMAHTATIDIMRK